MGNTISKGCGFSHLTLPYNKYGKWVDGEYITYDDMGGQDVL